MSVELIKKAGRPYKIQRTSKNSIRIYIPLDITIDSQFNLSDEYIASLVKIREIDGSERVGVFLEPPKKADEALY